MRNSCITLLLIGLMMVSCQKKPWAVYNGQEEGVGPFSIEYPALKVHAYRTGAGMGDTCFPESMAISTKSDGGIVLVTVAVHSSEEDFVECQRASLGDLELGNVGSVSATCRKGIEGLTCFLKIPDRYVSVWINESKNQKKLSHQIAATFKWLEPHDASKADAWGEHLKASLEKASKLPALPPSDDD